MPKTMPFQKCPDSCLHRLQHCMLCGIKKYLLYMRDGMAIELARFNLIKDNNKKKTTKPSFLPTVISVIFLFFSKPAKEYFSHSAKKI